ncbi:universal stress protein, partial [Candidatus Bipolaricaulota bacterium]|nr:universal stress protein [Candidatus Bipolaricaulota bacterium]
RDYVTQPRDMSCSLSNACFAWGILKKAAEQMKDDQIKALIAGHGDLVSMAEEYYRDVGKPVALLRGEASLKVTEALAEKQGVQVKTMIERGRAVETIVKIADEENVDVIVIGARGLTGLDRILLGSVAEKVSALAPCAVLIVR